MLLLYVKEKYIYRPACGQFFKAEFILELVTSCTKLLEYIEMFKAFYVFVYSQIP